jgi:hypothetical protein
LAWSAARERNLDRVQAEELMVNAVRHFFRNATDNVEAQVARRRTPATRIVAYLRAIGTELAALVLDGIRS